MEVNRRKDPYGFFRWVVSTTHTVVLWTSSYLHERKRVAGEIRVHGAQRNAQIDESREDGVIHRCRVALGSGQRRIRVADIGHKFSVGLHITK